VNKDYSAKLIMQLQTELTIAKFELNTCKRELAELQDSYDCAVTDLEATRKELLRATS
jgi:hypothetical protein